MTDCVFCEIIAKQISSEFIKEASDYIVIKDIAPKAPVHLLIISKKHIPSLNETAEEDKQALSNMLTVAKSLAEQFGLASRGYKVVINCGKEGGQVVPHLHFHFLGGENLNHPV